MPVAPPTAEERFANIVATLQKHLADGGANSFVTADDYVTTPGAPITTAKVTVEHELSAPDSPEGPRRAKLTLVTESSVTVVLAPQAKEDRKDDQSDERRDAPARSGVAVDGLSIEGVPSLDALKAPVAGASTAVAGSLVHEIKPETTRREYDLEYREGAWRLLTELDRENEPFFALAIEYALKRQ